MAIIEINTDDLSEADEAAQAVTDETFKIPDVLPVLPLRDIVIFPFLIVPLFVQREKSLKAVESVLAENRLILLTTQRDVEMEDPAAKDIHTVGTVAVVMRVLRMPDGRIRILVQGLSRATITSVEDTGPFLRAHVTPNPEAKVESSLELEALMRTVKSLLERIVTLGKNISPEVLAIAANLEDPGRLADLCGSNLELKVSDSQGVLEEFDPIRRLRRIHELMNREVNVLTVQQEITSQARGEIDRSQREFYLRQQLKAIQQELGEGNELQEEIAGYREKLVQAKMPEKVEEEVLRQLKKLERMHPDAAEAATLRNYMDIMVSLPWSVSSVDNLDLKHAQEILDEDHYGLEKVKERIIEALAVRKLKPDTKGMLLCLVGPPGVGKTSLGRSIARSLGRKFVRISLGGLHDEAEIRGHRRTYVGSMPGRIMQAIQQCGTNNPLMVLDEIDKVGADFRGDPSSALLEVLDPEQNHTFRDNYLGVPFDLSNVMFMMTANVLDTIQPALRDRMEIIRLTGYTEEEKLAILRRHIISKQMSETGIQPKHLAIADSALRALINQYTRESGLRQLEREVAGICRKVARKIAEGETKKTSVTAANLADLIGAPKFLPDDLLTHDQVGVATGLAWTSVGGDVLYIETLLLRGKGGLMLTGKLGDVMKESAHAALSYARSRAKELGIAEELFTQNDLHIHIPEGAIPKDGPSAGITMATAMISALSNRPVRRTVAMTGEITLRGNVLPIGGVKEKVLAARRAKIKTVILPMQNQKDIAEIQPELVKDLKFVYVDDVRQVLDVALAPAPKKTAQK